MQLRSLVWWQKNLKSTVNSMDVLSPEQRHKNMQHIRGADTKPELILRKKLWHNGYRYRKNYKSLPGKPDIVLTKYKICIFVDSEFFHGKDFESGYKSRKYTSLREQLEHSNNSEFWLKKIQRNMERDRTVDAELYKLGWEVIRFWSQDVLNNTDECIRIINETVLKTRFVYEPERG